MTTGRINSISALLAIIGSLLVLATGNGASALIWLAASVVWLVLAFWHRRVGDITSLPTRRILRRFSRLVLFT